MINETAEFLGRDPTELRPLGTRVDADSLDGLFAGHGTPSGRTGRSGSVAFEYHGLDVSVEFGPDRTFSVELTR